MYFQGFLDYRLAGHGLKRTTDDAAFLPQSLFSETPETESAAARVR